MGCATSTNEVHGAYHIQKVKLGEGSFGVVWRAVNRNSGETVAMKQLTKAQLPSRGVKRKDVYREIRMMKRLEHENVIHLYETFENRQSIYFALEYCEGGDFGDKVVERGNRIDETELSFWVRQMLAAINHMHSKHVCHRDIKPDNFLVASNNRLKLADLGLAIECPDGKLLTEKCGTPAFMAPEQHRMPAASKGYGLPADMWAAGVCMYMVMFGGRHPFITAKALNEKSMLNGDLDFSKGGLLGVLGLAGEHMSETARQLCHSMVHADALQRVTATAALEKPWLKEAPRTLGGGTPKAAAQ